MLAVALAQRYPRAFINSLMRFENYALGHALVVAATCAMICTLVVSSFHHRVIPVEPTTLRSLADGIITIEAPITFTVEFLTLMACGVEGGVVPYGVEIPCNSGSSNVFAEYNGMTIMLDGHHCGIQEYLTARGTEYRPTSCPQGITPNKKYSLTGDLRVISHTYGYMIVSGFEEIY